MDTTPPYTAYYTFGGKLVGMRRANYATSESNGQFRIVGDHLGSTTLVVDTSTPPVVVQRQYHKPYGEGAWQYTSGSGSLTNIGYTGQRTDEDSTGLMFYNARMYDPVLSFFVSADTITPEATNPKSRNRYTYVENNPFRYTDPSGHDPCHTEECQKNDAIDELESFGFVVREEGCGLFEGCKPFELEDLLWILGAIRDFMEVAEISTAEEFKKLIGLDKGLPATLKNRDMDVDGRTYGGSDIVFDLSAMRSEGKAWFQYSVIHELAHLWNARHDNALSDGMHDQMYDSNERKCGGGGVFFCDSREDMSSPRAGKGAPISPYGATNRWEDWAEAVAAEVYPGFEGRTNPRTGNKQDLSHGATPRSEYVRGKMGLSPICAPGKPC